MARTKAQIEKKKREAERRKQTEKAVLKLAAALPDEDPHPGSPGTEPMATRVGTNQPRPRH